MTKATSVFVSPDARTSENRRYMPFQLADLAALIVLIAAATLAVMELWKPGIQNLGDMTMSIYRVFELDRAWQSGVLYPRLGPDLYFGMGAPLFQFYPPLATYIALFLYKLGMGYVAAIKVLLTLNLLTAGLGVFVYVRWLTGRRLGALVAGILFTLSPYLLLVTYERGAVAESTALALLPWLVWAVHRLLDDQRFWSICLAALLVALTMLAHNITAFFVIPATFLYVLVLALNQRKYRALGRVCLAVALGLGFSAFYWLPALGELRYSRAESLMLRGETSVFTWLVKASELIQSELAVAYVGDQRFQFALLLFMYGVFGTVSLPWQDRRLRFNATLLICGWLAILILQLDITEPFWLYFPLVRFLQLPWRLFGLASLCVVLVVGMLLGGERFAKAPLIARLLLAGGIVLGSILSSTSGLRVDTFRFWTDFSETSISLPDLFERGHTGYSLFTDYTPTSMQVFGAQMVEPDTEVEIVAEGNQPAPIITIDKLIANGFELSVQTAESFQLKAPRIYFPGWQVYVDGTAVPTTGTGAFGLVTATIPDGAHTVHIQFDQTPLRRIADIVSWAALAMAVFGLIFYSPLPRKPLWYAGAGAVAILLLLLPHQVRAMTAYQPPAYAANLDNQVQLLASSVEPSQISPEGELVVRLYWYVQQAPSDNSKIFVHLVKSDDSERVAQADEYPVMGHIPTTRWEAGQIVVDEHRIPISGDVAPGAYLVVAGMYHPEPLQNYPVLSAPNTLPGDRLILKQVEITDAR